MGGAVDYLTVYHMWLRTLSPPKMRKMSSSIDRKKRVAPGSPCLLTDKHTTTRMTCTHAVSHAENAHMITGRQVDLIVTSRQV